MSRTIAYGMLDSLIAALGDLANNRLPLHLAIKIHEAGEPVRQAVLKREELRLAILQPYLGGNRKEVPPEDMPEVQAKVEELWKLSAGITATRVIDLAPILSDKQLSKDLRVKPETLTKLEYVGLLRLKKEASVPVVQLAPSSEPPAQP